jgi:hypothetical protein
MYHERVAEDLLADFELNNFLENREKMKTKMHYINTTLI